MDKYINKQVFCMFAIGSPGSGKSNSIRYLVKSLYNAKKFDYCSVFSPTYFSGDGSHNFLDKKFIHPRYTEEKMIKILHHQKKRVKEGKKSKLLLIFDDCIGSINFNSKIMSKLMINRRHFNISLIFSAQYIKRLSPLFRDCVDYVIMFKLNSGSTIKQLTDMWLHDINTREINKFINYFTDIKYSFCFIDVSKSGVNKYKKMICPKVGEFKIE